MTRAAERVARVVATGGLSKEGFREWNAARLRLDSAEKHLAAVRYP